MAKRDTTVRRRESLFREAVAVIERDYGQDLDLTAVAHRVATSRRQLQRAFQEVGRTTFRTYLGEVRMRNAAQLLREGGMPVREVAMRVGYRQPAQFAKAFRRYHGASPSSLRHGGRRLAA